MSVSEEVQSKQTDLLVQGLKQSSSSKDDNAFRKQCTFNIVATMQGRPKTKLYQASLQKARSLNKLFFQFAGQPSLLLDLTNALVSEW